MYVDYYGRTFHINGEEFFRKTRPFLNFKESFIASQSLFEIKMLMFFTADHKYGAGEGNTAKVICEYIGMSD